MSIDIDWAALTTGPSGLALAGSIRDFIHDKFQQVTLPRFIRSVHVHAFDFGEDCPVVELKDISDPFPEFYEDENEDDDDDEEEGSSSPEDVKEEAISSAAPKHPNPPYHSTSGAPSTATTIKNPPTLDTRPPNLNLNHNFRPNHLPFSPASAADHLNTPFLSRATTPGIPGGTSNFSYFHLPLSSAGLSGTATPLPWAEQPPPLAHLRRQERGPSTTTTTTTNHPTSHNHNNDPHHPPQTTPNNSNENSHNTDTDIQTTLHISYTGHPTLSLTAHLLLDYPMPSFVSIPLSLKITGLSFDGVALLAYLHRHSSSSSSSGATQNNNKKEKEKEDKKDVVHFCFLAREDAAAILGSSTASGAASAGHQGEGEGLGSEGESLVGGLLREIRVESEIGRQQQQQQGQGQGEGGEGDGGAKKGGGQVLKNVGKVEKFVLEQVRRILEEEVVWPSFWTFLV